MEELEKLERSIDFVLWKLVAPALALITFAIAVHQVMILMSDMGGPP